MNAFSFTQRTGARILAAVALFSLIAGMMPTQAFAQVLEEPEVTPFVLPPFPPMPPLPILRVSYCHVPPGNPSAAELHEDVPFTSWTGHLLHGSDFLINNNSDRQRCLDLITPPPADTDGDTVPDTTDNCPNIANTDQANTDGDAFGNACDSTPNGDTDNDGVDNNADNCPNVANPDQADADEDEVGDVCDTPDPVVCENTAAQNYGQEGRCIFHVSQCSGEPMNLLTNGSFEEPEITKSWDKSVIAGWTVAKISDGSSSLGEIWRGLITPSHLAQNIELDGDYPTKITQTVATIPGATYELSFDFAARAERPTASNNAIKATAGVTELVNISTSNTNWVTYGNTFVASASTTSITLADMGTDDTYGTLVDNAFLCLVREPEPVDFCEEIKGTQTADEGYLKDKNGMCYMPITSCSVSVVSDTTNTYNDTSATLITAHPAWVQTIASSTAKWIWGTAPEAGVDPVNNEVQTFKKTFVWSGVPATAILKLASDNGYSVKLNGTIVAADSGEFNYSSLDTIVDLTDDVIVGVNTLEVSVTNLANGQTSFANNPGGVIYDLTITNTSGACAPEGEGDGDGDGEGETEILYTIYGYVWHDDNRNEGWDGRDDEEGNEQGLGGRTVTITKDQQTFSTTTDENGYYEFRVPAGTWTITEEVEGGWMHTTQTSHVVTVPEVEETEETILETAMNFIIPTAHAALVVEKLTYGEYNFGNDRTGGGGGRSLGDGDDDDSDDEPDGEVAGISDDAEPTPLVLGEQVSAVPLGAADAGAGSTSPVAVQFYRLAPVAFIRRK